MKKCIWSGKEIKNEDSREVFFQDKTYTVHRDHQKFLEKFMIYQNKRKYPYLATVFVCIVPMLFSEELIAPMLVLQALNLWVHPFSTSTTVNTLGIKNSIVLVKISSLILLILAGYIHFTLG